MKRQLQPGQVLAVCLAHALDKTDPNFLERLKASVLEFRRAQPPAGISWETLQAFYELLDDPEIFRARP